MQKLNVIDLSSETGFNFQISLRSGKLLTDFCCQFVLSKNVNHVGFMFTKRTVRVLFACLVFKL